MADVEMAPAGFNPNVPSWIAVTVKSSVERKDIVVQDNRTVEQFKGLIAKELCVDKEQLCLVFHSTTLDSQRTLKQCGIDEGSVVRVVVKSSKETANEKVPQNQAEIKASPFGLGVLGGLPGLFNLGFGSLNFADLQTRIQKKVHSEPALLKSLLDNPLVKDILSRPDIYSQLVASNPCVNELVQESPGMVEVLGNATLAKEMMELVAEPSLLNNCIDPEYKEFIDHGDDEGEPIAKKQKLEEKDNETKEEKKTKEEKEDENAVREAEDGNTDKDDKECKISATESLLKQMIDRAKDMAGVLQAPYMQNAINFTVNNQECLRLMMNHIPGVNDSEALKKQLDLSLPYIAQQLVNPDVHGLMCNPRALQAVLDIHEGMRELEEQVPGYFGYSKSEDKKTKESEVLGGVLNSITSHLSDLPDEEKYSVQMRQLHHMGFTDHDENLRVLVLAGGDINTAIIHHLQHQQSEEYRQSILDGYNIQAVPLQQSSDGGLVEHHQLESGEEQHEMEEGQVDDDQSDAERLLLLQGEATTTQEAELPLEAKVKSEQ